MNDSVSPRIVRFIGSLSPLYDMDYKSTPPSARQLSSGARISPVDESESDEEAGLVAIHWPRCHESWTVEGRYLATEALVRYVDLHGYGRSEKERRGELLRMSDHFAFKTGMGTYLELGDSSPEVFALLGKLVRSIGEDAVTGLLKSALGLP